MDNRRAFQPFFASGASMAISKRLFQRLDGFDPLLFAYGEDIDLCWRARLLGYKILCVPSSVVYHRFSASFGIFSPRKYELGTHGQILAMVKSLSIWNLLHSLPAYMAFAMLRGAALSVITRDFRFLSAVFRAMGNIVRESPQVFRSRHLTQHSRRLPDRDVLASEGFGLLASPREWWRILHVARLVALSSQDANPEK
jgi:GT2 family glycosyltransferase